MDRSPDTLNTPLKKVAFPPWASVLFREDIRYISLRGGRGSGKSMSTAKALVIRAAQSKKPLRILCGRETMKSLKDSVFAQLEDEIKTLGLEKFFTSTLSEIRGKNGSVFLFAGLSEQTADGIKSMANVDLVWLEEAATISEKSWQALLPTIRKETSQFIICWNPDLTDDATYRRFVINKPKNCIDLCINYDQNPWFPKVLEAERLHDQGTLSPAMYRKIWEGLPMSSLEGSVYEHEVASLYDEGRSRPLAVDNNLSLHAVFDLGWADDTAVIIVQATSDEVRLIDFIEDNRQKISVYSDLLKNKGYGKATIWLPHDARQKNTQTGMSMEEKFAEMGWSKVEITPSISVEDGILAVREMMPKTVVDSTNCKKLIEHVRRYTRSRSGTLVHDQHSHASDGLRYVAINAPAMRRPANTADLFKPIAYPSLTLS